MPPRTPVLRQRHPEVVPRLTARQDEIHTWMMQYQEDHGMPPSLREIAEAFDIRSTNAVSDHLRALERKGRASHREGIARGWRAV